MRKLTALVFCVLVTSCTTGFYYPKLYFDTPDERWNESGYLQYGSWGSLEACEHALAGVIEKQKILYETGISSFGPLNRAECKEILSLCPGCDGSLRDFQFSL